jgi:hypothetical protein
MLGVRMRVGLRAPVSSGRRPRSALRALPRRGSTTGPGNGHERLRARGPRRSPDRCPARPVPAPHHRRGVRRILRARRLGGLRRPASARGRFRHRRSRRVRHLSPRAHRDRRSAVPHRRFDGADRQRARHVADPGPRGRRAVLHLPRRRGAGIVAGRRDLLHPRVLTHHRRTVFHVRTFAEDVRELPRPARQRPGRGPAVSPPAQGVGEHHGGALLGRGILRRLPRAAGRPAMGRRRRVSLDWPLHRAVGSAQRDGHTARTSGR